MPSKYYIIIAVVLVVACLSILYCAMLSTYSPLGTPSETKTPTPTSTATPSTTTPPPTEPTIQTTTTPSVPQFTINYVKSSYEVEPTYTTDPYTGETTMTRPARTVTVSNIEVVIKNQAFSSYQTADGNYTQLRYCVRAKGHYEQWMGDDLLYGNKILDEAPASSSDNTILTFPLTQWSTNGKIIGPGGEIDFQVKAIVRNYYTAHSDIYLIGDYLDSDIIAESDWSSTQTFTVPSVSSSASP